MKFYDDDMDDLFNKAGRDYPLKTEPKNWEAVRGALLQENGEAGITQKRNGWRRLLPLLFLLLIPAVYLFVDKDNVNSNENINRESNAAVHSPEPAVANTPGSAIANTNEGGIGNSKTEDNLKSIDNSNDRKANSPQAANLTETKSEGAIKTASTSRKERDGVIKTTSAIGIKSGTGTENNFSVNNLSDELKMWNNIPSLNTLFNSRNEPSDEIALNTPARSWNQSATGLTSVPNSDKKSKTRKGPYLGLIAAPDLSTIKGQEVKGIGYSAGAIVGYTINNHWQVEGGVLWSHKKYYTDGKYFDKTGPGIPASVNMLWLNGGCEMLEFPVVARYNFSQKRNTFFASAGLTSYLMKKEDYNYKAVVDPGNYAYTGYREYNRSGDHLFANLQLSAGYNFSLSSKLNIRIEPYLKTPLKKIGIGKMPITSTGLYFAITRDFR